MRPRHQRRHGRGPRRPGIIGLIQEYGVRGQLLAVPALAIAGASPGARTEEADDLPGGLALLDNVTIAPLCGAKHAARPADIIARTGLDPWDAHAARLRTWRFTRSLPLTPRNGGSRPPIGMTLCISSKSPTRVIAEPEINTRYAMVN